MQIPFLKNIVYSKDPTMIVEVGLATIHIQVLFEINSNLVITNIISPVKVNVVH